MQKIILLILFQAIFINAAPIYRRKACGITVTVKNLVTVAGAPPTVTRTGQSFCRVFTSAVTPSVSVRITAVSLGTAQVLPTVGTQHPGTIGVVLTKLQTDGLPTSGPILSNSFASPTSLIRTANSVTSITSLVLNTEMPSSNIFQPVDTDAPPSVIGTRSDHPVARLGIQTQNSPLSTNKFYANFFLGSQTAPTWTHPYSLAWAKGGGSAQSWGMSVSHIDSNQRVFGPDPAVNPANYFINPNGIQSLVLSAAELGALTTISTDSLTASSINVNLLPSSGAAPAITFPLVQGMGFVTGLYNGGTPIVQTGVFFRSITRSALSPKAGVTKYTICLEDGKTWLLYAYSQSGAPLSLKVVSNNLAKSTSNWYGIIQIAKNPGGAAEALYDAACGAYATSSTLSGSANGATGTYSISFTKTGLARTALIMFALPHHVQSFSSATRSSLTSVQLQTTTKGLATAVTADSWILVEPNMPIDMHFAPWRPGLGTSRLSASAIAAIQSAAVSELSQDMNQQTNLNSFYYAGKALAKFAGIIYIVHDIVKNPSLAQAGLVKLKAAFELFSSNKNQFPLVYETAWGGIVSTGSYAAGDPGVDFGNTYYNDHHFHFGYFIYAAAIIGTLDPDWVPTHRAYVNTLVRDIANPSTQDRFFPLSRAFDWYHGHSWAHGLYESYDGKDQESSSEDSMSAYALKLWGRASGDANLEARGNLQLAITARALQAYFLYTNDNKVQPGAFVANKVAGILFENKIDHTTYFGAQIEYIQGIHMIPLLPCSTLTRSKTFVREEWDRFFSGGRADAVAGGWRGLLYANLAIVDPVASFNFFNAGNFDPGWLDGGASRTWYLAWAAGLGGSP